MARAFYFLNYFYEKFTFKQRQDTEGSARTADTPLTQVHLEVAQRICERHRRQDQE